MSTCTAQWPCSFPDKVDQRLGTHLCDAGLGIQHPQDSHLLHGSMEMDSLSLASDGTESDSTRLRFDSKGFSEDSIGLETRFKNYRVESTSVLPEIGGKNGRF